MKVDGHSAGHWVENWTHLERSISCDPVCIGIPAMIGAYLGIVEAVPRMPGCAKGSPDQLILDGASRQATEQLTVDERQRQILGDDKDALEDLLRKLQYPRNSSGLGVVLFGSLCLGLAAQVRRLPGFLFS